MVLLLAPALLLAAGCGDPLAQARADLETGDRARVIAALKVLGEKRDRKSVPFILPLLGAPDAGTREQAARALGRIGDTSAINPLADFYGREEIDDPAEAAIRALVRLGRGSVPVLIDLTRSGRPEVRAGSAWALGQVGGRDDIDPLIRLLDDRFADVQLAAVRALRRIGGGKALDAVARAIEDQDQEVGEGAQQSLGGEGYQRELERAKRIIRSIH